MSAYTVIRCSVPLLEQTHPVQDVSPALHRDALEHSQHGKCKVIKVRDSIIWALPSHHALRYIGQGAMSSMDRAWGTGAGFSSDIEPERKQDFATWSGAND